MALFPSSNHGPRSRSFDDVLLLSIHTRRFIQYVVYSTPRHMNAHADTRRICGKNNVIYASQASCRLAVDSRFPSARWSVLLPVPSRRRSSLYAHAQANPFPLPISNHSLRPTRPFSLSSWMSGKTERVGETREKKKQTNGASRVSRGLLNLPVVDDESDTHRTRDQ